jgi:hypothetical protein
MVSDVAAWAARVLREASRARVRNEVRGIVAEPQLWAWNAVPPPRGLKMRFLAAFSTV